MRCIVAVYVAVHKTVEIPQLQFIAVVDPPFWRISRSSWSRLFSRSLRLQLLYVS